MKFGNECYTWFMKESGKFWNNQLDHMINVTAKAGMEWIQLLIFHQRSWDNPEMLESMIEARQDAANDPNPQPLHGLQGQAAACVNHHTLKLLEKITASTLVIGGEDDIFTPVWMAREIDARLPNNTLHLYPKSGHAFHWENLEDFNQKCS